MTKLEAAALKLRCPACHADPGVECLTPTGFRAKTHKARLEGAALLLKAKVTS